MKELIQLAILALIVCIVTSCASKRRTYKSKGLPYWTTVNIGRTCGK